MRRSLALSHTPVVTAVQLIGLLSHGDAAQLRKVMPEHSVLSSAMTLVRFHELVASVPRDAAVIDLEYCRPTDLDTLVSITLGIPVLACITLSVSGIQRLVRFASSHGDTEPMIRGHEDLPGRLRGYLGRIATGGERAAVAAALEPLLATLPTHLSFLLRELFTSRLNVCSVEDLARLAYMSRRRLERMLGAAGLASPQTFIVGASLLRHFDALASADVPTATICRMLGIADARTLNRHCRAVSGLRLADIRAGMAFDTFLHLVIRHVGGATRHRGGRPALSDDSRAVSAAG